MNRYQGVYAPPTTPRLVESRAATQQAAAMGQLRYAAGQQVEAKCPYTQTWRSAVVVEPKDGWCRIELAGGVHEKVTNERLRPRKGD